MAEQATAQIGVTGLAVMGRNLARNLARHGYTVAVHNRIAGAHHAAWSRSTATRARSCRRESLADFVASLERPRAVDHHGEGGRAHRRGDRRAGRRCWSRATSSSTAATRTSPTPAAARRRCASTGLHFVGTGVSGGEEGALHGPSIMPGGSAESYEALGPMLEEIAAQVDGEPCCAHVGPDGAGHFVKMVHNGIEYADMQLIAEAYDLLRHGLGGDPGGDRGDLPGVERRRAGVVPDRDHRRGARPHRRRRPASRSSTSCSTRPSRRAPAAGPCRARSTWASRSPASPRRSSPGRCPATPTSARPPAARCPAPATPWQVDGPGRVRRGRAAGAVRLEDRRVRAGLRPDPGRQRGVRLGHRPGRDGHDLAGRLHHPGPLPGPHPGGVRRASRTCRRCWSTPYFADAVSDGAGAWRRVVADAARAGVPAPGFSSALAYYDGLRAERLPAALIQGLRDYFGAHTYHRVDREGAFHTLWATARAAPKWRRDQPADVRCGVHTAAGHPGPAPIRRRRPGWP